MYFIYVPIVIATFPVRYVTRVHIFLKISFNIFKQY